VGIHKIDTTTCPKIIDRDMGVLEYDIWEVHEVKQKSAPTSKEDKWIWSVNNRTRGAKSTVGPI